MQKFIENSSLENRLLKYSLLNVGMFLSAASVLNAGVVVKSAGDFVVDATHSLNIDFESAGDPGFSGTDDGNDIQIFRYTNSGGGVFKVNRNNEASFLGVVKTAWFSASALNDTQSIPTAGNWGFNNYNVNILNFKSTYGKWINKTNKYLAVKFLTGAEVHYGWVCMTITSTTQAIVHSYAYETTANTGIPALLPVELTDFTGFFDQNNVKLNWATATEINNYGFDIERKSAKNVEWEKIGFVPGYGNSNSPKEYNFIDKILPADILEYRLKQLDNDGKYAYSKTITIDHAIVSNYALAQNYPNPFNPTTVITYQLPVEGNVVLKVYDVLGNEVKTLVDANQSAGMHKVDFSSEAENLAAGMYIYKLKTGNFTDAKKMLLVK